MKKAKKEMHENCSSSQQGDFIHKKIYLMELDLTSTWINALPIRSIVSFHIVNFEPNWIQLKQMHMKKPRIEQCW